MNNPETPATFGTRDRTKTNKTKTQHKIKKMSNRNENINFSACDAQEPTTLRVKPA